MRQWIIMLKLSSLYCNNFEMRSSASSGQCLLRQWYWSDEDTLGDTWTSPCSFTSWWVINGSANWNRGTWIYCAAVFLQAPLLSNVPYLWVAYANVEILLHWHLAKYLCLSNHHGMISILNSLFLNDLICHEDSADILLIKVLL